MISVNTILETLKTDAETKLPDLIYTADLTPIDIINRDINRDTNQCGLYIYTENIDISPEDDIFILMYHFHMPDYTYSDNKDKYLDVIKDYIYTILPSLIGFNLLERINIDVWPTDMNGVSIIYFTVTFKKFKDSCD